MARLGDRPGELPDGGAALWSNGDGRDAFRLVILRSGAEAFGYLNRCAHFGVPLSEKPEHLIYTPHVSISCNVHYARYRWTDGYCESGDCKGESLIAVPVSVDAAGCIRIAAGD